MPGSSTRSSALCSAGLGVALTGSDTASNVLFGGLQKITAEQLGLSPILMGAANCSGGVMGKMIDAQSIVVASTATNWFGHEGAILRFVFLHSIALACLVGVLVMAAGLSADRHDRAASEGSRPGPCVTRAHDRSCSSTGRGRTGWRCRQPSP